MNAKQSKKSFKPVSKSEVSQAEKAFTDYLRAKIGKQAEALYTHLSVLKTFAEHELTPTGREWTEAARAAFAKLQ